MQFHARLLALASATMLAALPASAGDRALLIGINDYKASSITDLPGTAVDVQNMRQLLVEEFFYPPNGIKLLTEADATRAGILEAIEVWLIDGTRPGDRIYLYFSGHGAQVTIPDGNGGTRLTSGLVPQDADNAVDFATPGVGGLVLGSQLGELVQRMAGRDVTIVVDACHSGSLTRSADGSDVPGNIRTITPNGPVDLNPADITDEMIAQAKTGLRLLDFNARGGEPMEGVAVWNAATLAQYSYDSPSGGIFTRAFISGIKERHAAFSGDGRVSVSSQLAHVRDVTSAFCASHPQCPALGFTPELLAPDPYRALILAPYAPGGESLIGDNEVVHDEPPAADDADEVAEHQDPDLVEAPPLVDLAEGVFSHQNDFALEAAILPGNRVALGDTVRFRISSERTGQVIVLDSGPDGALRRIFPNDYSEAVERDGIVTGGRVLTIPDESYPFEFTATDPGPGSLVVLVTERGVDLGPLLSSSAFEIIDDVERALVAIAAELQEPALDPDPDTANRAREWAFVTVPYMVGR